jgi:hypothetical protein
MVNPFILKLFRFLILLNVVFIESNISQSFPQKLIFSVVPPRKKFKQELTAFS